MIAPRKLVFEAKKKENDNLRFRTFLKCNADEEELDRQFSELHAELFEKYDCSRCRNCCKSYHAEFMPIGMVLMSIFAFTLDSSDPKSNWIEQITNGIAQAAIFVGIIILL